MPQRRSCVRSAKMPKYTSKRGWRGGDTKTLYAITDNRTGSTTVRPGEAMSGIGPAATIRVATRQEAEKHWQSPLHAGWKVLCDG